MITTLIFDLDGILIDLCDLHKRVFLDALLKGAGIKIDDGYHDRELNALPTRLKLEKIGVVGRIAIDVARIKQELTLKELENIQPDDDLKDILNELNLYY